MLAHDRGVRRAILARRAPESWVGFPKGSKSRKGRQNGVLTHTLYSGSWEGVSRTTLVILTEQAYSSQLTACSQTRASQALWLQTVNCKLSASGCKRASARAAKDLGASIRAFTGRSLSGGVMAQRKAPVPVYQPAAHCADEIPPEQQCGKHAGIEHGNLIMHAHVRSKHCERDRQHERPKIRNDNQPVAHLGTALGTTPPPVGFPFLRWNGPPFQH